MASLDTILSAVPFFRNLDATVLGELEGALRRVTYGPRSPLFSEGDACHHLYLVERGNVRVYRLLTDGKEYTIDLLGPSEPVALVAFLDGGPFPASAEALEATSVALLPRDAMTAAGRRDPRILEAALAIVCTRLREAHRRETELALKTVHERIASVLLDLAGTRQGTLPPLSHEDLAGLVGAARETVTRALHDLERGGAVRIARTGTTIWDRDRLLKWVDT